MSNVYYITGAVLLFIGAVAATYGFVNPDSKWWLGLIIVAIGLVIGVKGG